MPRGRGTLSIRESLARSIVALVLMMSVTLLVASHFVSKRAVGDLSARLIEQSTARAEEQLETFFGSIEDVVLASRAWWDAGLVEYSHPGDIARLNALFIPVMDAYPQVTSMMLVDETGFEYLLFRDLRGGDQYEWYNRVVQADRGPDAGFEMLWTGERELYREGPLPDSARDYDPRKRPFYKDPPEGEIYWTDPYYFFITKDAGMTACFKWSDPETGEIRLVAFDLLLMDLSGFTTGMHPSRSGKAFVMFDDGSLLGIPRDPRWTSGDAIREALRNPEEREGGVTEVDRNAQLLTARDFNLSAVADAADYWRGARKDEVNLFRYTTNGNAWWGGFQPFSLADHTLWTGVVIPENDFLNEIRRQRSIILTVAAIAVCVAILMAAVMARRFSRPLEMLAAHTERVRELNLTADQPVESNITEVQQLANANAQMIKALDSFARYVPMDVVRELLRRGEVARIGGTMADVSILFTDIEGFTSLAEQNDPQELTARMAEYFSVLLEALSDQEATVDKFIGDAVVAFWGAPHPNPDHARFAVRAVVRAVRALDAMNEEWSSRDTPPLRTRFGLNSGEVIVGNVGSPDRMNYTVLGDAVNLASRLESLNTVYGSQVLAAGSIAEPTADEFVWRRLDRVAVKGKSEAVDIHELLGERVEIPEERLRSKALYEEALEKFFLGEVDDALRLIEAVAPEFPDDRPLAVLLERLRTFKAAPPAEWDGITRYDSK